MRSNVEPLDAPREMSPLPLAWISSRHRMDLVSASPGISQERVGRFLPNNSQCAVLTLCDTQFSNL